MKKSNLLSKSWPFEQFLGCNQCNLPIFCLVSTFLPSRDLLYIFSAAYLRLAKPKPMCSAGL